jgi:hypothetical protein
MVTANFERWAPSGTGEVAGDDALGIDAHFVGLVMTCRGGDERSKINLAEKLSQFDEHWSPRTVTTFNGHDEPTGTPNTGDSATVATRIEI